MRVKAITCDVGGKLGAIKDPDLLALGERVASLVLQEFDKFVERKPLRNDVAASIIVSLAVNLLRINCQLSHEDTKDCLNTFADAFEEMKDLAGIFPTTTERTH